MPKVLTNHCYGGFGMSEKAYERYIELKGITVYREKKYGSTIYWTHEDKKNMLYDGSLDRDDPILIQVFEELGSKEFSGPYAKVDITEVPDGVAWSIEEYDGKEWVSESHRVW